MADIIQSLFGLTPEAYQRSQAAQADKMALEYAQLSPMQQAQFAISRGGYQLGGAFGRALGGEDPQLRMISNRNAIARQIDPTDLQSMMRGIQALQQAGDSVGAMQLAQVYQQRMKVLSDIAQNQAAAESSRASTGKTQAETEVLRRKEAELIEATKAYRGEGGPAQPAQAQTAGPVEAAMPPSAAAQPAAQPVDRPVAAESVFPRKDAVFSNPTRAVSEDEANSINRAINLYNRVSQLAAGETPSWWAGKEPLDANARQKELDRAESIRQSIETLYGMQLIRPYGTPSTAPRSPIVGTPSAPAAVASAVQAAPAAPAAPAAQTAAARAETSPRVSQIETRLSAIRRARAAGVKDAELEGKQLEDELKAIREASKPTEIEKLITKRNELISGGAQANSFELTNIEGRIANLQGREIRFGEQREAYAQEQFRKPFAQLTQAEQKVINARVDAEAAKPRVSITNQLPGVRALADIPAFRRSVQATIDPQLKSIDAADQALRAIDDSIKTNNFVSFNAARVQLAKALGDSQLSRRDVEQAGGDPSLLGGLYDATSRLFTGTPSLDTQNKIKATLNAIRTVSDRKARAEVDVQRNIALSTPGYDAAAVERALSFPQLSAAGAGAGSLADQARAELERRRQAGGR